LSVSFLQFKSYYIILIGLVVLLISFLDNILFPRFLDSLEGRTSFFILLSFVSLFSVSVAVQIMLLHSVLKMNLFMNGPNKPSPYNILIITILSFLVFLLFVINTQLFQNRSYSLFLFILIVIYDFVVSSILISLLIFKLSTWVRRKKNFHGFLYVISFSMILITLTSSAMGLTEELVGRPSLVTPTPNPWDNITTRQPMFYDVYRISSLISFGLFWLATSILLRNYSTKKIGRWKYWILVTLPMIYYIGTIDFLLNNYLNSLIFQFPNLSTTIFYLLGITKQVGGFFFALSFIFMSKDIENIKLKFYLLLTALGIMMLFSSIQISILHILPYPPFGLITLSITPISSYLLLLGLYNSAKSLSYDRKFLLELRRKVKNESNSFLSAIGSAEWNKNLETSINDVLKQIGKEDERDYTLRSDEVRNYVLDVIKELKRDKSSSLR
jgi:hypothetical protein